MKTWILISLSLIVYCSGKEIATTSKVTEVIVFRKGAQETRSAAVTVPKGSYDVVISDIPLSMTAQSLQVAVKGSATLLSVMVRDHTLDQDYNVSKNVTIKHLQDSIKNIDLKKRWIVEQKVVLNGELDLINNKMKLGNDPKSLQPTYINTLADMYRTRVGYLKKKLFELTLKDENLTESIESYQLHIYEISVLQKPMPTKEIILSFYAETRSELQLHCHYQVTEASWLPCYDIKAESTLKPLKIGYKAQIFQHTGSDWNQVTLKVSTGNPSNDHNRPVMTPKYIDYVSYELKPALSNNINATNMMYATKQEYFNEGGNLYPEEIVLSDELNMEYKLEIKHDIPSDHKAHVFVLQQYEVPVTYTYHIVPKLNQSAFLLARMVDHEKYNFLPGMAHIFYEDTYIGEVQLNPSIANDTMLISLGRDEHIVVKRARVLDKASHQFLSGMQTDTYIWQTLIHNQKQQTIEVEVLEQIPLSRNNDIEVKLVDNKEALYDPSYGKLLWRFKVGSGTTRSIKLSYKVKHPQNKRVQEQN